MRGKKGLLDGKYLCIIVSPRTEMFSSVSGMILYFRSRRKNNADISPMFIDVQIADNGAVQS